MSNTYLLGIDVGGTAIKMALFTKEGPMIKKWSIPTDKREKGSYIPDDIERSVIKELENERITLEQLEGVGLGVPGFVDIENGTIEFAVNIGWRDFPLAKILSKNLSVPVFLDNDANLAAAGEYWKGAGRSAKDMICFTIGTGVGGGVIVGGNIVHGVEGMAGEVGHITVDPFRGKTCNCGKTGCLETVASATGMVSSVMEKRENKEYPTSILQSTSEEKLTTKEIFEAAARKDPLATAVIEEAALYIGLAAANACTLLNPERIVIGGGVSAAGEALLSPIQKYFQRYALEKVAKGTEFVIAELGNDAGVTGAAWLAAKSLGILPENH
ncbi:ROK family glucokinase [Thalassobacillus sp. C254]|uniref:ROK family glucokinase n=1 Tax=Thalassobacillus sp. C254 TaxID=1225341 RepID=UPI0006D2C8B9|nr:ROK family glucokinase [Thalassobacillus sp. C254]